MALPGTIRALEPTALAQLAQTLLRDHVPARHHHRRILVRRLLLGNRADKDGVEVVGRGQRDLDLCVALSQHRQSYGMMDKAYGKFVLRRPFRSLLFHDSL